MEKSKDKKLEKNSGITLIALVITIIVLLILAGVTIQTLTGENGLITKTDNVQKETMKAEGLEKIEVEVVGSYNSNGEIDKEQLKINLQNIEGIKTEDNEEINNETKIEFPILVKLNNNEYIIKSNGTVKIKGNGISEYDIIKSPKKYYGMYVTNYNSPNDEKIANDEGQLGKWQIFMADEDNIYLIASSYINFSGAPTKNNKAYSYDTNEEDLSTVYKMWWNNDLVSQYSSIDTIENVLSKIDNTTKQKYHKWINMPENKTKGDLARRAILNMIDIDAWSIYKNTNYGEYAIGGPTLEMFCHSYNNTHTGIFLTAKENYEYGYMIQKNNENDTTGLLYLNKNAVNDMVDKMLFNNKVNKYHLASTSSYYSANSPWFWSVGDASLTGTSFCVWGSTYTGGFRPLVCLKSNVHFIENTDENNNVTYELELD